MMTAVDFTAAAFLTGLFPGGFGMVEALLDTQTGERIPVRKTSFEEDFREREEYEADVLLTPGEFRKFRFE